MLLLCMVRLNDQNNLFTLYRHIAKSLNSEEWMNTQTTSFALIAVSKTMEKMNADRKGLSYVLTINKKVNETIKTSALLSTALTTDLPTEQEVKIKNTSTGAVFVNYYTEGIPKAGQSEKTDRNLETSVKFIGKDKTPSISTNSLRELISWPSFRSRTNPLKMLPTVHLLSRFHRDGKSGTPECLTKPLQLMKIRLITGTSGMTRFAPILT